MLEGRIPERRLVTRREGSAPARSSRPVAAQSGQPNLAAVLWRRRWIVLACTLLSLSVGVAYLWRTTKIFEASSQVYVQQLAPKIIGDAFLASGASGGYVATQCQLITSTPILSDAVEKLRSNRLRSFEGIDNPVALLKASIEATVGKQNDLVTVSMRSPYPQEAALIVNNVVDAYITYQSRSKRSTAAEVLKILEKQLALADAEREKTSQAMIDFKRENGTLSFQDDKGNIITQRLAELSQMLMQAQVMTLEATLQKEAVDAIGDDADKLRQFIASQAVATAGAAGAPSAAAPQANADWSEYRALRRKAMVLQGQVGPEHRELRSLNEQLQVLSEEAQAQDEASAAGYRNAVTQRLAMAKQKEKQLSKAYDDQRKLALDLNTNAAQYSKLESDLRRTEKLCDVLDSRIKEINVNEDAGSFNVNVLEVARAPGGPVFPQPSRVIGMALLGGLMLGFGGAMLRDWMDHRLRSADEIAQLLELPVLGIVPHMQGKQTASVRGTEVHVRPRSETAEAYRTVRTAIHFGAPQGKSRTLLVTSPSPGDGKTTVASNLAIAMAQAGKRVILVDADCRRPMLHTMFGLSDKCGLSSVLLDGAPVGSAIQPTQVENLDVLPCGPVPSNPSELLNGQAFADLIEELLGKYEQVVIDSPPLAPVTDARILAASCDVTVMVLRAEKSTRRAAEHARDSLLSVGGQVLGVVVNDVPQGRAGYGYYAGDGYGRRYGYGDDRGPGDRTLPGHNGRGKREGVNGKRALTDAARPHA